MKDMKKWQLSPIDRRNYERFRKVALGIYRQAGIIDFTTLETTPIKTFKERFVMKDIEVNGAHITDESAEILKQWQVKTEPVSACYIRVIEETIDDLTDEGGEPLSAEK